jgi:hypothetical protein
MVLDLIQEHLGDNWRSFEYGLLLDSGGIVHFVDYFDFEYARNSYVLNICTEIFKSGKSQCLQPYIFLIFILFICAYNVCVISPPFPPPPPNHIF